MNLPVWCACGKIVTFAGETRCEDCWADEQRRLKFVGKPGRRGESRLVQNVRTMTLRGPEVVHESSASKMRPYRQPG